MEEMLEQARKAREADQSGLPAEERCNRGVDAD